MSEKNKHDFGTKLMDELMVDIVGALIPGFLFIIVVFVSVVLPCSLYGSAFSTKADSSSKFFWDSGSFWWVMLIASIIFSYVVGHIFFRADIAVPDKKDVDRQVKAFVENVKSRHYGQEELVAMLQKEIGVLKENIIAAPDFGQWLILKKVLSVSCKNMLSRLEREDFVGNRDDSDFLCILFPEECLLMPKHDTETNAPDDVGYTLSYASLSQSSRDVLNEYETYFGMGAGCGYVGLRYLFILYCALHCQMDIGCATARRCEFPYINYYKYLLKRNMPELLKYVDWYSEDNRTKNRINALKIRIHIFVNEAYALMNKNESHIRMSSSTWHISKVLLVMTGIMSVVFIVALLTKKPWSSKDMVTAYYVVGAALPVLTFAMVLYLHCCITKYIHYQRLREIQYTLQIYDQYEDIIRYRRSHYGQNECRK